MFHFFSKEKPFFPISLHSLSKLFGISKGLCCHLSFFLTSLISSKPKGLPWEDAFPDLFGDPKPIVVLQDITVGFFAFCTFLRTLKISIGL